MFVNYDNKRSRGSLILFFLVKPDIFTTGTVPGCRDPFLFSFYRVLMAEHPDEFQITIRASPFTCFFIILPTNRIHQCIRGYRI